MRILVCTKRDLHGAHFLNRLLPALGGHELLGVWLSNKAREAEKAVPALATLRFLEATLPVDILFPLLDARPDSAAEGAREATFAGLARRHRLPVEIVDAVNGDAPRRRLQALAPDLLIVARFSHLFDAATLDVPRFGTLNVHPGQLPDYAGLHAPLRTLIDGADALACSVHWITPGIDDGPLLAIHRQPLAPAASLLDATRTLYPLAIPTLLNVIDACAAGRRPPGEAQDLRRRRYRSLPAAADFEALARRGVGLWQPDDYQHWLARFLPPGQPLPSLPAAPR